jgi:hypothetical protein
MMVNCPRTRTLKKIRNLIFGPRSAAVAPYQPSKADLVYRDAAMAGGRWYRQSMLLRAVSREHLAGLTRDACAANNAGMKQIFNTELSRRGFAAARSTDRSLLAFMVLVLVALVLMMVN